MTVDLENGLVLHLPLDEGYGSVVYDKSPEQNHGAITGAIFVKPYNDMADDSEEEGEAPLVIIDDGEAAFWTLIAGVGTDDTGTVKKGANSYKVVLTTDTLDMYHDYGADQDWSKYNFITLWIYGCNTSDTITLYVYNEVYAGKTNGYSYAITDDFTGWRRFIIPLERFSDVAVPTGWDNVRCIELLGGGAQTCDYFFDRFTLDIGNWRFGDAMDFDGTNDNINISTFDIDFTQPYTIVCWVNPNDVDTTKFFLSRLTETNWRISFRNTGIVIWDSGAGLSFPTTGSYTAKEWQMYTFIFDGTTKKIYRNLVSETKTEGCTDGSGLEIGQLNIDVRRWNGLVSNIRIYNRALSPEEIRTLYKEKEIDLDRGLILDLPLNEGDGEEVKDRSKHQNHGDIIGTAVWDGNELDFDGLNDYVITSGSESLSLIKGDPFTLVFWFIRAIPPASNEKLFTLYEVGSSVSGVTVSLQTNSLLRLYAGGSGNIYTDSIAALTGTTVCAVFVSDGTNGEWYVNGKRRGSADAIDIVNLVNGGVVIGAGYRDDTQVPSELFDGIIKNVRLYNRVLSSEEIRALYLQGH